MSEEELSERISRELMDTLRIHKEAKQVAEQARRDAFDAEKKADSLWDHARALRQSFSLLTGKGEITGAEAEKLNRATQVGVR